MNAADISRVADKLPCTLDNLLALVCIAERFAMGLHQSGEFTNSEDAHAACVDAFIACEQIGLVTLEMRSEWELDRMMNERKEAA